MVALPPISHQEKICRFLDIEISKIDVLISKQEQLIATLLEDRVATIANAATKGLDSKVEMIDSGVEWIGAIPRKWRVTKLAWHSSCRSGEALIPESVEKEVDETHFVPVVGGNGVMGYSKLSNVSSDVIVVGRVGALCGNVHQVSSPAWITDNALVLQVRETYQSEFLAAVLSVRNLNDIASKTAQPLITGTQVLSQRLPLPPLAEQRAIVNFIRERSRTIDALIEKSTDAIAILREYRSALIAAAVTGKIDVRGEV
ncbi:hypothetical protein RE2895_60110 (plasmid) [Rhodococcus erythropolis]|nr:hypothetical protein RE2895_60110 [Rhodococcus erythropolis]